MDTVKACALCASVVFSHPSHYSSLLIHSLRETLAQTILLHYLARTKTLMMRSLLLALTLLPALFAWAQKKEEQMNELFKPTNGFARYFVTTEQTDSGWHRKAWYLPEKSMAMDAWFEDEACNIPHGKNVWFHTNRSLKSTGTYVHGKKEGPWMEYHSNGIIKDSATYVDGRLRGIRLKWHSDGALADSMNFDGKGNGVQVSWNKDGAVSAAGYWTADTLKRGRWQYFHPDGTIMATEDYDAGNRVAMACYDEAGKPLPNCDEREASFPGGEEGWRRFLERKLNAMTPINKGAPPGNYTVIVRFVVKKDGSIEDVKATTNRGYGTEDEVVHLIQKGPKWVPAMRFGQPVKSYRSQPVTFVVSKQVERRPVGYKVIESL